MPSQTIICPSCGKRIPITEALTTQIEAGLRKSLESELNKREMAAKVALEKKLAIERVRLEKQAHRQAEQALANRMTKLQSDLVEAQKREKATKVNFERRMAQEGARLEKLAKLKVESQFNNQLATLQKRLKEKDREVSEIRKRETELQKQKSDLVARERSLEANIRKKTEQAIRKVEQQINDRVEGEYRSKQLQLEKKLSDAKKQATDLKRKLEQSSQQAQGEVAELELENVLRKAFPDDKIEAVRKGQLGADILQKVYSPDKQLCGTIIWETKTGKDWQKAWLPKLRNDQRRAKAHLAILVSHILPKDVTHFAQIDGVWVTEFPLALGVATALRSNLIQVSMMKQSLDGKHDKEKVELLFAYLSGTEFKHRVEAIVEAFRTMQDDLDKERSAMEKHWTLRGKQLQLVIQNVSNMYGEFQGIVGQTLPRIRRLELPSS